MKKKKIFSGVFITLAFVAAGFLFVSYKRNLAPGAESTSKRLKSVTKVIRLNRFDAPGV